MSIKITIGSTVINFPSSGTDANWAEAMDEFATAVTEQLAGVGLTYDVPPQVEELIESGTNPIPLANFPNVSVRGFTLTYSAYRVASSPTVSKTQTGTVIGVYDATQNLWTLQHEFTGEKQSNGEPYITFDMNSDSLEVTTVSLGGLYDQPNSKISFTAKTLPVSL